MATFPRRVPYQQRCEYACILPLLKLVCRRGGEEREGEGRGGEGRGGEGEGEGRGGEGRGGEGGKGRGGGRRREVEGCC